MSRLRWLVLVLIAFAIPFTLAACDDDNNEDEDQITAAIEASATSTDPAVCTTYQTQNFNEQTSGATGQQAIKECEEDQQEETVADSVDVSDIEIDDGSATAVAALTGGFIDGQSLEVGLVEEDGQWRMDELIGFREFDRAQYVDTIVRGIAEDTGGGPQIESCIRERVEGVSDEELQATFLENDDTFFEVTIAPCFERNQG
jgi:hypothetical protein